MTKDRAIQVLQEMKNLTYVATDSRCSALDMAIESLSADSVRIEVYRDLYVKYIDLKNKTEWTPCSERLPRVEEQVLCCDSQSRVFTSALTEIASNGMTFFGQHCKVIAWMPLPKPYRERR